MSSSNSAAGKEGRRSASATSRNVSSRYWRCVSIEAPSAVTDTVALRRSNASRNSARERFSVPRSSMPPASAQAVLRPALLFSSPQFRLRCATTLPPRVLLGSRAVRMPLASVRRSTRASMFFGEGSNASPAASAAAPL